MKKISVVIVLFLPILLFAGSNDGSAVLKTYTTAVTNWIPVVTEVAYKLFYFFALFSLILEFGFKFLNNDIELGSIASSLIKIILIFGLFKAFIDWQWLYVIFDSFNTLGDKINTSAGISTKVSADTLTDSAYELMKTISKEVNWYRIDVYFIGLIAIIAIIWLSVELITSYVKFLIMWAISPLFLAMGVFSHTRQWALSAITAIVSAALEYMLIKLVIGLSISVIKIYAKKAVSSDGSLFTLLTIVLIIFGLTKMVHGIVSSMFSGHLGANNISGFQAAKQTAQAAMGGLVGGAMGAYSQIKNASSPSANTSQSSQSTSGNSAQSQKAKVASVIGGAIAGAMSGGVKGAFGYSTYNVGNKSGKGVANIFGFSANSNKDNDSSSKDRNGFDTSLINDDSSSMSGEIKPS